MIMNMGTIDRVVRLLLAVTVAILYLTGVITGLVAIILGVLGLIFVVASVVGFCPIYVPLSISTRRTTKNINATDNISKLTRKP
jgi:hypothetical protein